MGLDHGLFLASSDSGPLEKPLAALADVPPFLLPEHREWWGISKAYRKALIEICSVFASLRLARKAQRIDAAFLEELRSLTELKSSYGITEQIIDRFAGLNPYDFGGSILRFTEDNYIGSDPKNAFRQLLALVISAKRYATYERHADQVTIIGPKAHGLGYLYPPADSPHGWDDDHELPKWVSKLGNTSSARCSSSNPANRRGSGGPR
jgi:hypothetical protein